MGDNDEAVWLCKALSHAVEIELAESEGNGDLSSGDRG